MARVAPSFFHIVKNFLDQNDVVLDKMAREKGRLTMRDDVRDNRFELVGNNLDNNFIANI